MKKNILKPSDLPTKKVRSVDGSFINLKVVKSDSDKLDQELLAAFRSNVRRIIEQRRRQA